MTLLHSYLDGLLAVVVQRLAVHTDHRRRVRVLSDRVTQVRRRYRALDASQRQELRRSARRLTGLRQRLALLTGSPSCCTDCSARLARSIHQPPPQLPGGYCCGGDPVRIFEELEVAALWLDGRAPSRWSMVRRPAGCMYRGDRGCRLRPVDRPSICARYLCSELTQALARTGALSDIMECNAELEVEMARIGSLLGLTPSL